MYYVYVLRNPAGRHYTGYAVDTLRRLGQHNSGISKSTKNRGPWTLVYQEQFATRSQAMKREKFLKSGQGRKELRELLGDARSSAG